MSPTPSRTTIPSATSSPTITPTLPPLETFQTKLLYKESAPATYVSNACEFLKNRWDPERSAPGTVVVPVMWHGIDSGEYSTSMDDFQAAIYVAKQEGFKLITMNELADFLEGNAKIPPRSMVWIVDDRIPGTVETYFLPLMKENKWMMSMAWPIADTDKRAGLWERVEALHKTGFFEVQSHGYLHNYPLVDAWLDSPPEGLTTEEFLQKEIVEPIAILEKHFGSRPIAYVWPGGGFSARAVAKVRDANYRLGFTSNAPGPLLYNWIPLRADARAMNNPLLVLPREWGKGLSQQIELTVKISQAAIADARTRYPAEAQYFKQYCGGELPPMPDPLP